MLVYKVLLTSNLVLLLQTNIATHLKHREGEVQGTENSTNAVPSQRNAQMKTPHNIVS